MDIKRLRFVLLVVDIALVAVVLFGGLYAIYRIAGH